MHAVNRNILISAVYLSALAGYVDAVGFLQLGGYFISFMSGNSTRLAVSLAEGDRNTAGFLAMILILFVIGSVMGMAVRRASVSGSAPYSVLALVTLLLLVAALCGLWGAMLTASIFLALAMGAENAVLERNGETIGLTYMTGALVKIGHKIAGMFWGESKWDWIPYFMLWLGLICGGILGSVMYIAVGLHSLWLAAACSASMTFIMAMRCRLQSE